MTSSAQNGDVTLERGREPSGPPTASALSLGALVTTPHSSDNPSERQTTAQQGESDQVLAPRSPESESRAAPEVPDSSAVGPPVAPPRKLGTSRVARSAGRAAGPAEAHGRRLHAGHFAFMRAVVQGVDVAAAWDRYLRIEGESSDGRVVRSTIAWIRDEFSAAAQRHARFGVARLVRLDTARLASAGARLPTLETFAVDQGLEDFSEAEQLEAYEAEYRDVIRRARRRQRLIERQLQALGWLESLVAQPQRARRAVAQPPRAEDGVQAWFNPLIAGHLQRAGLLTLGSVVERINGIGQRWYVPIRGLGAVKAERIVSWLRDHEATLASDVSLRLGTHVDRPRSVLSRAELAAVLPPATGVRPLEKLVLPPTLDGSRGTHRRPQFECLLDATNDLLAIEAWLASKAPPTVERRKGGARHQSRAGMDHGAEGAATDAASGPGTNLRPLSNTQRSYRKEAERLLLWAIVERQKPLSSLSAEDGAAYRGFLGDPQPRERWCAARSRERWSPLWRPFEGPLSPAAQQLSLRVVGNLFNFLQQQNYLAGNPFASVKAATSPRTSVDVGRAFSADQWAFIVRQAEALPPSPMARRLELSLQLLRSTGLRLSEAVAATVDDLRRVEYQRRPGESKQVAGWMLRVLGKGARVREVPVPERVVEQLRKSLAERGLPADPLCPNTQGSFILGRIEKGRAVSPAGPAGRTAQAKAGVTPNALYAQLKRFFQDCGTALESAGDPGAERFKRASTHWLRHTHATQALEHGVPLDIVRHNLGHASLATTSVYLHADSKRQLASMATWWEQPA